MSDRITELETKLAFQENTIEELNEIVTKHQDELITLNMAIKKLHEQIKQLAPPNIASIDEETPPPHY